MIDLSTVGRNIGDLVGNVGSAIGTAVQNQIGVPYTAPAQSPGSVATDHIRNAIASVETGGVKTDPYSFQQPSGNPKLGNALGKYQVTEGVLNQLGSKYLGQQVTPQQFLASPALQDNFMNGRIAHMSAQGYTPQQIADMHNAGTKYEANPGATTYQNPKYVSKFNAAFSPSASSTPARNVASLSTP